MEKDYFDYAVIGGGIFGIYCALYLSSMKARVLLVERQKNLMSGASTLNQARLHGGYHYPRSTRTAVQAQEFQLRFKVEHDPIINTYFKACYGIDRYSSLTSPEQFESFCNYLRLPLHKTKIAHPFKSDQLEALYQVEEYSIDNKQLAIFYQQKMQKQKNLNTWLNTEIDSAVPSSSHWVIQMNDLTSGQKRSIMASSVINATYSNINQINRIFEIPEIPLSHEVAEIALFKSSLQHTALTIIDGEFVSLMPFGFTGLCSLSSVRYTCHGTVAENNLSLFNGNNDAMIQSQIHTSNYLKMLNQFKKYVDDEVKFEYIQSYYTLKSKLKSSYIDDSRPTVICKHRDKPEFYSVFGGKVSSIYEIEKHIHV